MQVGHADELQVEGEEHQRRPRDRPQDALFHKPLASIRFHETETPTVRGGSYVRERHRSEGGLHSSSLNLDKYSLFICNATHVTIFKYCEDT